MEIEKMFVPILASWWITFFFRIFCHSIRKLIIFLSYFYLYGNRVYIQDDKSVFHREKIQYFLYTDWNDALTFENKWEINFIEVTL